MKIEILTLSLLLSLTACTQNKEKQLEHTEPNSLEQPTISVQPVNETAAVPGLPKFLDRLTQACNQQDTTFLLESVIDTVAVSYGGGLFGKEAFLQEFIKDDGFNKLKEMIKLGGAVDQGSEGEGIIYVFPYVHSYKLYKDKVAPFDELDPYLTAFGIVKELPIFAKPQTKSRKKAIVSYPILRLDPDSGYMDSNWAKVSTLSKQIEGFVQKDKLYFSADNQLIIQRIGNEFKIVSVAPYD